MTRGIWPVSKSHMSGNLASAGEKLGKLKWLCTRIEITSRTKIEQEQRTDQKINLETSLVGIRIPTVFTAAGDEAD
jgi:hypothetical protein